MKAVIPLAGLGTRLRPQTYTRPKPLVNLAGKPLLGHILERLESLALEEVIFITGYLGSQIEEYVRSTYTFPARFVEQEEQRGQSDAIRLAAEWIAGPTFVVFADTIFETDIGRLDRVESDGLLYVKEVADPRRFGVAVLDGPYIARLVEKPKEPVSNLATVGLYYFREGEALTSAIDEQVARGAPRGNEYFIADAIQIMIDRGAKLETEPMEVWLDCGTPDALLDTNRYLLGADGSRAYTFPGSTIVPPVFIGDGAAVENSIVGPHVSLDAGGEVRGSIVRDSILGKDCHIQDATLSGSIVGHNATVVGGYSTLNVGDSSYINMGPGEEG